MRPGRGNAAGNTSAFPLSCRGPLKRVESGRPTFNKGRFDAWLAEKHAQLARIVDRLDELGFERAKLQAIRERLEPPKWPNLTLVKGGKDA